MTLDAKEPIVFFVYLAAEDGVPSGYEIPTKTFHWPVGRVLSPVIHAEYTDDCNNTLNFGTAEEDDE